MANPMPIPSTPPVNSDAVVTIPGVTGTPNRIEYVQWNYNRAPTGGQLHVTSEDGTTLHSQSISKSGSGMLRFANGALAGKSGQDTFVTLTGGGPGVKGSVQVQQKL